MDERTSTEMKKQVSKQTSVNEGDIARSTPNEGAHPSRIVNMT